MAKEYLNDEVCNTDVYRTTAVTVMMDVIVFHRLLMDILDYSQANLMVFLQ